jgi:AsmA protein
MLKRRTTVQDGLMSSRPRPLARPPRQRRRLINPAVAARGIGLLVAVLVAIYLGLPLLVRAQRFRPQLESVLRGVLGRPVQIRELRYSLRTRGLIALDLSVDEDPAFGKQPFLLARTVTFETGLLPPIFGSDPGDIDGIVFDGARISLKQDGAGDWNFYSLLRAADRAPAAAHPRRIRLNRSRVSIAGAREGLRPLVLRDLALDISDPSLERPVRLALAAGFEGGGSLSLNGTTGPLAWNRVTPAIPASLLINVEGLSLAASGLAETVPALDGILSLDGSAESDGAAIQWKGELKAEGLRLARNGTPAADPVQAAFSLRHDLAGHTGALNRCDLQIGKGSAGITGTYSSPPAGPLELHLEAAANGASVTDLAPLLPAAGFPLPRNVALQGGLVFAALQLLGPPDRLVTAGTMSIQNATVSGLEMADRLASIDALAHDSRRDLELTSWRARLRLASDGAALDDIQASIPGFGDMAGKGGIGPDGALEFRMTAAGSRGSAVPFVVRGTFADPVFRALPIM